MANKATILIVDREKILVDLLTRALATPGVSVLGTTSAEEAARLLDRHEPDLMVIDPTVENGIPLLAALVAGPLKARIVTTTGSDEVRDQVRTMGVGKTVDRNAGLDALSAAIRSSLPGTLSILDTNKRIGVLIADDEDEVRDVVAEYLSEHGFAVTAAKNGREALERLSNNPSVQIVLLDLNMPIMGGMEALREIMKTDPHPNVIMMTAVADREIARQAMKTGAFDYILKPCDFAVIEASIAAALSHLEYQKQPWWKRLTRR
ncbi:MAG TPA: response regulator [Terriglobia bacterium]|nr:response regulator [Terriglobia bacterium]